MNTSEILSAIDHEISRLEQARSLLQSSTGLSNPPSVEGKRRGRPPGVQTQAPVTKTRTMSDEGRARIAAAQKARWAAKKKADTRAVKATAPAPAAKKTAPTKKSVAARTAAPAKKTAPREAAPAKKAAAKKVAPAKKASATKAAPAKKASAKKSSSPIKVPVTAKKPAPQERGAVVEAQRPLEAQEQETGSAPATEIAANE